MAWGIPVVMTDDGGSSDYAVHEKNAIVVPSRNPALMAVAIANILVEHTDTKTLIENGLARAKKFTWEKTVDKLLNIFETWLKE